MTEAPYLARVFMEHVLLKFGLCIVVVCDDGNDFRGTFEKMCRALNIRFHVAAISKSLDFNSALVSTCLLHYIKHVN